MVPKKWVLGLVEDKPAADRVGRTLRELGQAPAVWPASLERQAEDNDDWLAACALHTVWATQQKELLRLIDTGAPPDADRRPLVHETITYLRERMKADAS